MKIQTSKFNSVSIKHIFYINMMRIADEMVINSKKYYKQFFIFFMQKKKKSYFDFDCGKYDPKNF